MAFAEAYPPSTFVSVIQHSNPAALEKLRLRQVRRGVYDGVHKLAVVHDQVEGLFDTQADPNEVRDISAQNPALAQRLQGRITDFVKLSETLRLDQRGYSEVDDTVVDSLRALGYIE